MTTLKAARFHIHRREPVAPARPGRQGTAAPVPAGPGAGVPSGALPFASHDDGFGDEPFGTARAGRPGDGGPGDGDGRPAAAGAGEPDRDEAIAAALDEIRKEGLTERQLRTARRLAERHNLAAASDLDAVRLLREAGIDPFRRGSMMDLVAAVPGRRAVAEDPPPAPATGRALAPLPGDTVQLPQTAQPVALPSTERSAEADLARGLHRIQADIARRRRRRIGLLAARMFAFVLLPTIIAGWYFTFVATPLYATVSEFMIQQQNPPAASGLGGLLQGTSLATSQDSIAVQGYLQSRDAMLRLERDHGFRKHFQGPGIDPILRLADDATLEETYRLYSRYVQISYDQSEGIIKMEVSAPNPQLSVEWSRQLINYAEEQVDQLTQRLREDSMKGARESYDEAEQAMLAAQGRVVELQEKFKVLSSEVEVTLLTQQIAQLETQLSQDRLSLAQMEANATPNQARMEPLKRRIATLEEDIAALRKKLTEGDGSGESLARIQGELMVAQADVQTRQLILAQALQAMELARVEANRQVRYLAASVSPVAPDEPTYPRAFENTLVTFLILLGIYLMISMTVAILHEQVST